MVGGVGGGKNDLPRFTDVEEGRVGLLIPHGVSMRLAECGHPSFPEVLNAILVSG